MIHTGASALRAQLRPVPAAALPFSGLGQSVVFSGEKEAQRSVVPQNSGVPGFESRLSPHRLCDLGLVAEPLCASLFWRSGDGSPHCLLACTPLAASTFSERHLPFLIFIA